MKGPHLVFAVVQGASNTWSVSCVLCLGNRYIPGRDDDVCSGCCAGIPCDRDVVGFRDVARDSPPQFEV